MGREAIPLIFASEPPQMPCGIEVMTARARLLHGDASDPSMSEEESLLTVLVSFDPTQADRWSARALASTYVTARCSFAQNPAGAVLADWLLAQVVAPDSTSICAIVLALPDQQSLNVERQVVAFVNSVKAARHLHLQLTVAVASNASSWASLDIDGFVRATPKSACRAALHVFDLMASLMAPGMVHCVDAGDLKQVLGPAGAPSHMASGAWFPAERHLSLSVADRNTLQSSASLTFLPAGSQSFSSLGDLHRGVRALVATDTELVAVVPYGLRLDPSTAQSFMPIQFLCRSYAAESCQSA